MTLDKKVLETVEQPVLFGYKKYFNFFINLIEEKKLPNVILFNGPKGIGKSTFAYHLTNYYLSINEKEKYSTDLFRINTKNSSFNLIKNNIHPNFFLLDRNLDDTDIKIEKIRELLKFLSKSTYRKDLKIVLLDNAEYLNLNSSNALLKSLEDPSSNTYFIIINNSSSYLSNTIKSRCVEFKFNFSILEKKEILKNLFTQYNIKTNFDHLDFLFTFETPGNILKYLFLLDNLNFEISKIDLSFILALIEKYKSSKDLNLLCFLTLMIEKYYNNLSLSDSSNVNNYHFKKEKILYLIHNLKTFNLDKKNILVSINNILKNE